MELGAVGERTFTNKEGQTIEAALESFNGEYIEIRRSDGRLFTISLDTLSKKDQDYVQGWQVAQAVANDREVLISARRLDENATKSDLEGIIIKKRDGYYEVLVENRSGVECKNLEIRWAVRVEKTDAGSVNDRKGKEWKIGKWKAIDLGGRSETKLETERVLLEDVSLKPGWKWGSNAPKTARDKLAGFYLAIFSGGEMVREYSLPSGMLEDGRLAMNEMGKKDEDFSNK